MPLITIEHTSNISDAGLKDLAKSIHVILEETCRAKLSSCKSQIQCLEQYVIGDGLKKNDAFLIIHIGLMPGRTAEEKKLAAKNILTEVDNSKLAEDNGKLQLQVRLRFFDLNDYFLGQD